MTSKGHYPTKFEIIWRNYFQNISRKTNIRSTVPVQLKPEVKITDEKGTPPKTQAFIFGPVNGKLALLLSWLASRSVFCFVFHMKYFVNINNSRHSVHLFTLHRVVQFPQQHAKNHRVFMVSFLSEMNYFATHVGKFITTCMYYLSLEF